MFLAGLKFAMGFLTGMGALGTFVMCVIALAECSFLRKKEHKHASQKTVGGPEPAVERKYADPIIVDRSELSIVRSRKFFLVLRYPSWVDEPEQIAHPKSKYTQ